MSGVVRTLWERGRIRWPELALGFERFALHVPASDDVAEIQAEDLFLALACAHAVPGAAEAFRNELAAPMKAFIRTVLRDGAAVDELANLMMVELLVGDAGSPRL